jgi:hypothetical protein
MDNPKYAALKIPTLNKSTIATINVLFSSPVF